MMMRRKKYQGVVEINKLKRKRTLAKTLETDS
jgi:hypothetical protein